MDDKPLILEDQQIKLHAELQEKHKKLNERIIRNQAELVSVQRELEKEKKRARDIIGTDDVAECREIYTQKRKENSDMLYEVMETYKNVEAMLDEIDRLRGELEND